MKSLIVCLCILSAIPAFSQNLKKADLIGKWTAKTVTIPEMRMEDEQMQIMESLKDGFVNSSYTFHPDGTFNLDFTNGIPAFMKELEFVNNTSWKFNESNSIMSIGTEKDNYTLMGIIVRRDKGQMYFVLEESPFTLEMVQNK